MCRPGDGGLYWTFLEMREGAKTKTNLILIQMGSDYRVPKSAMGYLFDLADPQASQEVVLDRLAMLERHIPDLVQQYRDSM